MMQNEDRIKEMHLRAGRIKRRNDKIRTAVYGVTSLVLMVFLVVFTFLQGSTQHNTDNGQFAATSMLDASVGGYVIVALISFAVAVVLTLFCIKWKNKNDRRNGSVVEKTDIESNDQ